MGIVTFLDPRSRSEIGVIVVRIRRFLCVLMPVAFWLCVGLSISMSKTLRAEYHASFQPIKELFAAMSRHDGEAMNATATEDFQLLEHGEDWTMQQLVNAVQPKGRPYERRNFFNQIRARQSGDMAWISYWNKAEIVREGETRIVVWLESAVMIRKNNRWKIQLLHSTRLEPEKYPKNIHWVQFHASP